MLGGFFRAVAAIVVMLSGTSSIWACPLCESETGERVRAGLFNADFACNLFVTLLPFSVFLTIIALIHFGWPRAKASPQEDLSPRRGASETPIRPTGEDQSWTTG